MHGIFVPKTRLGGDCCEGDCDDRSGDSVIESALYVERLPHSIRNPLIRDDRRARAASVGARAAPTSSAYHG